MGQGGMACAACGTFDAHFREGKIWNLPQKNLKKPLSKWVGF